MVIGLHLVLPPVFGLEVLPGLNDDRIGQVPFQRGPINPVFVVDAITAKYLRAELNRRLNHARIPGLDCVII